MSHEQLLAMVQNAQPTVMTGRGAALTEASGTLKSLSDELHTHVGNLDWTGDAGDAFKGWANQVSASTLLLSEYAATAGSNISAAGNTLAGVKGSGGIPPLPTTDIQTVNKRNSQPNNFMPDSTQLSNPHWVTSLQASAAQTRIDNAHQEAIHQMTILGQSYDQSTTLINAATPPLFPPTPVSVMGPPPQSVASDENVSFGGTGSGGSSSRTGSGGSSSKVTPGAPGKTGVPPGTPPPNRVNPVTPEPVPVRPVGPHPSPGPVEPNPVVPTPVTPTAPGSAPPSTGIDSGPSAPTLPPQTGSTGGVPTTGAPGGGGIGGPGGYAGGGYVGAGGGLAGGGFAGGGTVGGKGAYGSVNYTGSGASGRPIGGTLAGDDGISGGLGRPSATSGRSQLGANAFGADEAAGGGAGAGGASGGMGAGGMGGHAGGGAGGFGGRGASSGGRGRGLTSTAGGEVGGSRSPEAGGEFTPGGTGLRARAGAEAEGGAEGAAGQQGFMPGGSHGTSKKSKDRRNRAAYLVEDEETWTGGTPESNPNVIE
ncbi:hypothetical protein [Kitasatospora sp. MAA4]|uniref:WXG100 family type VII secretion target n=1 Tax=Kitasatospora sp. MAA4 TaxID=3035093 RepID=UPI0024738A76|nr:hypothetical protein [Kitasatospora sp. MAA4]